MLKGVAILLIAIYESIIFSWGPGNAASRNDKEFAKAHDSNF